MGFTVEFTVSSASISTGDSKSFENIRDMRDFMKSAFFSKSYHVRGIDREIRTAEGFLIGRLV
jgi:hypothetical protein